MFKNTELEGMGINVNEENLNHVCFVDNIMFISGNLEKAEILFVKLMSASYKIGLKINTNKT